MIAETPSSLCTAGATSYRRKQMSRCAQGGDGSARRLEWSGSPSSTTTTVRPAWRRTRSSSIRCSASPALPGRNPCSRLGRAAIAKGARSTNTRHVALCSRRGPIEMRQAGQVGRAVIAALSLAAAAFVVATGSSAAPAAGGAPALFGPPGSWDAPSRRQDQDPESALRPWHRAEGRRTQELRPQTEPEVRSQDEGARPGECGGRPRRSCAGAFQLPLRRLLRRHRHLHLHLHLRRLRLHSVVQRLTDRTTRTWSRFI